MDEQSAFQRVLEAFDMAQRAFAAGEMDRFKMLAEQHKAWGYLHKRIAYGWTVH